MFWIWIVFLFLFGLLLKGQGEASKQSCPPSEVSRLSFAHLNTPNPPGVIHFSRFNRYTIFVLVGGYQRNFLTLWVIVCCL